LAPAPNRARTAADRTEAALPRTVSRPLVLAASTLAAVGCARCGEKPERLDAEALVAADASLALSLPAPGDLADRAQTLIANARGGPGGAQLVGLAANLAAQLGFDPLKRDGLRSAGLDPTRSIAVSMTGTRADPGACAALPYSDLDKLEQTLARLAKDRVGASVRDKRTVDARTVRTLRAREDGPVRFAWTTAKGYLFLCAGGAAAENVAAMPGRPRERSLASVPAWAAGRRNVGAGDVFVYVPRGRMVAALPDAVVLGLRLGTKEASLSAYTGLPADKSAVMAAALPGGGDELLRELPADAPLYVRGGLDLQAIVREAEKNPAAAEALAAGRRMFAAGGLDLDRDFLENLQPSFAVAVGIAGEPDLSQAFQMNPRVANPFRTYTVLGLARVRDRQKALDALAKLPALGPKAGLTVEKRQLAGNTVWVARYALGEGLAWALRGDELLLAGGMSDRLAELVAGRLGPGGAVKPEAFEPRARDTLFARAGVALAVDFSRIAETVTKLPDASFGQGPGAFMAHSVMNGIVQPMSRLKVVAAVRPAEAGLIVELAGSLQ